MQGTVLPDISVYPDPFLLWLEDNWIVMLIVFAMSLLALNAFSPWIRLKAAQFHRLRLRWAYMALMGQRMSIRAKNKKVGERLAAEAVKLMDEGAITRKEKREILRKLEVVLELDQGDLGPRAHKEETKRRIRGRIKGIIPMSDTKSGTNNTVVSFQKPPAKNRLNSIMSKQG